MQKLNYYQIPKQEVLNRIVDHGAQYDLNNSKFDVYDQLMACDAVAETEFSNTTTKGNDNASVNDSANDTCRLQVNSQLNLNKIDVIKKLKICTSKTPPKAVATLLEQLFEGIISKDGHWLYVAQHWTPRAINRVINQMIKMHKEAWLTIQNPAAYFTLLLKYRKKRKKIW